MRRRLVLVVAATVSAVVLPGCGGDMALEGHDAGDLQPGAPSATSGGSFAGGGVGGSAVGGAVSIPALTQKVIKNADISLTVAAGTVDDRFSDALLIAGRHGGYAVTSRSSSGRTPTASLVLRVPASEFEPAITELKKLGRVTSETISGEDVTEKYVDLEARLRNLEAQEAVLLRLMDDTDSIDESLEVQRALQDVQLGIEELRGQLRVLDDQTALSTITVGFVEQAPPPKVQEEESVGFGDAWSRSMRGLSIVAAGIVVAAGYALPFLLLAALGFVVWRLVRRRLPVRPEPTWPGRPDAAL